VQFVVDHVPLSVLLSTTTQSLFAAKAPLPGSLGDQFLYVRTDLIKYNSAMNIIGKALIIDDGINV
jgi:hypothetical protein